MIELRVYVAELAWVRISVPLLTIWWSGANALTSPSHFLICKVGKDRTARELPYSPWRRANPQATAVTVTDYANTALCLSSSREHEGCFVGWGSKGYHLDKQVGTQERMNSEPGMSENVDRTNMVSGSEWCLTWEMYKNVQKGIRVSVCLSGLHVKLKNLDFSMISNEKLLK